MSNPQHLKIFLSSPSDVGEHRREAFEVLRTLERAPLLRNRVTVEVVSWDDPAAPAPLSATETPQKTLNRFLGKPSDCAFTVVILWGRLGTPLPADMRSEGGAQYASGTAWELDDARRAGKDVFIYHRKDAPPIDVTLSPEEFIARKSQYESVVSLLGELRSGDGSLKGAVNEFTGAAEFRELFRRNMELVVQQHLNGQDTASTFRIFIANAADDMAIARMRLSSALREMDAVVVDGVPPPTEQLMHSARIRKEAAAADLCIHFLGVQAGIPVDWADPGWTYPAEQVQLALEEAQSQVIFHPLDLAIDGLPEGRYKNLLRQIQARPDERSRIERVQIGTNTMLDIVRRKRKSLEEQRQAPPPTPRRAFIDVFRDDYASVEPLTRYLMEKDILPEVNPYVPTARPQERMALFVEGLRTARYFIVVCGTVAREVAAARACEALKAGIESGLRRAIGLYLAPQTTGSAGAAVDSDALALRAGARYVVIDNSDSFDVAPIDAFLGLS